MCTSNAQKMRPLRENKRRYRGSRAKNSREIKNAFPALCDRLSHVNYGRRTNEAQTMAGYTANPNDMAAMLRIRLADSLDAAEMTIAITRMVRPHACGQMLGAPIPECEEGRAAAAERL
jgi:hypothetical protein